MPSFAISEGLVVTPSRIPSSFASLIWARLAVSIKNFILDNPQKRISHLNICRSLEIYIPLQGDEGVKKGRLLTSHRSTTYSCCLPALGGFSRSWSCKTCRRKDKEAIVFGNCENEMHSMKRLHGTGTGNSELKRSTIKNGLPAIPFVTFRATKINVKDTIYAQ